MVIGAIGLMVGATVGAYLGWRRRQELALKEAYRLVQAGLPNESDLVKAAALRFQRRLEASTIGGWLGGVVSVAVLLAYDSPIIGLVWTAVIGMFGVAIATCLLHFRAVRAARRDGPRTASLGHRRLRDYLIWPEIVVQYGVLVLPLGTGAIGVMVLTAGDEPRQGRLLVAVAATCLVICAVALVLQRRVLHLSQAASQESELRWEEALRASTLRDVSGVLTWACWILGGAAVFTVDISAGIPAFVEPLTYVLFGGGVLAIGAAQVSAGTKWGLRRSQRALG